MRQPGTRDPIALEFLVAADILVSATPDRSFERLGILAVIIRIRTFLSLSLEVEIDGHWPWKESEHRKRTRQNRL